MPALDFTVRRYGTDTSGRPLYFTVAFWTVWCAALADDQLASIRHRVVVVQGAHMARVGGGATASAGYHDKAGCIDVRTWNLTLAEQSLLWRVMDDYGIRFWKRGPAAYQGGMDEHGHGLAVWDRVLAAGAAHQATQARARQNGLANGAPDYMPREHPVLEQPPAHAFEEDYMSSTAAEQKLDTALGLLREIDADLTQFKNAEWKRDKTAAQKAKQAKADLVAALGGIADQLVELEQDVDDAATKDALRRVKRRLLDALAADPDIDGPDNPAPAETDQTQEA